jgi:hypothetical protein
MIADIIYNSNFILGNTGPFTTGDGTTSIIYEPWVLGPTAPFITGSGTHVEFKNMISFVPPTRSVNFESGSVLTYMFDTLTYEEINGFTLGPTQMPSGNPYKETIIVS